MVIWLEWKSPNDVVADRGRVGLPFPSNEFLALLKRENNWGSFGMPGGWKGHQQTRRPDGLVGLPRATRPFSDNGPLSQLTENTTQRVKKFCHQLLVGWGGGERNLMATGFSWEQNEVYAPGLEP